MFNQDFSEAKPQTDEAKPKSKASLAKPAKDAKEAKEANGFMKNPVLAFLCERGAFARKFHSVFLMILKNLMIS